MVTRRRLLSGLMHQQRNLSRPDIAMVILVHLQVGQHIKAITLATQYLKLTPLLQSLCQLIIAQTAPPSFLHLRVPGVGRLLLTAAPETIHLVAHLIVVAVHLLLHLTMALRLASLMIRDHQSNQITVRVHHTMGHLVPMNLHFAPHHLSAQTTVAPLPILVRSASTIFPPRPLSKKAVKLYQAYLIQQLRSA